VILKENFMFKKSIIALLLFLSFFLIAMINISLLQERTTNYVALEKDILSFMFYVGMSLMPLLIYYMAGDKIKSKSKLMDSKLFSLQIVLAFLIPILFYYNIYFNINKVTELIYAISTFTYSINFMVLYVKVFYYKNDSNEIVTNLTK